MYFSLTETWIIDIKTRHEFRIHAVEGFFEDNLRLYVDEEIVAHAKVNAFRTKGYALFDVDGRTLELRWVWSMLAGDPVSIVVMHKGRVLAQYGTAKAAIDSVVGIED